MEEKSFYTYVMVGVILHVVLAKDGIPSQCNITAVTGNNIIRIKSLKAGKYLKAELKQDGVRTLSFTGNETDCGTFFVQTKIWNTHSVNYTFSLPGMPDVCLAVLKERKRKLALKPLCDPSKVKYLFTSKRVYLSDNSSAEPERYHILISRRNRSIVKSSKTGKIFLGRYNWKDCGAWVKLEERPSS